MAITKSSARQELITAVVDINFGDIPTTATAYDALELPANSIVVSGDLTVVTAWATTTTATLSVGDATLGTRFLTAANLMVAGRSALVPTGFKHTNTEKMVKGTTAITGAAATAGYARLSVQYYVQGRSTFAQGLGA